MTAPSVVATIFDKMGNPLTDVVAEFSRTWKINGIGECVFRLAKNDNACHESYLRFGNLILIQSNLLDDWVGVIDTPRKWYPGVVEVHAYTANKILNWRVGDTKADVITNPGNMFVKLVTAANQQGGIQYSIGTVVKTGGNFTQTLDLTQIGSEIRRICNEYNREYAVLPRLYDDRLGLRANFYEKMGKKIDQFYLDNSNTSAVEGMNIYTEQGEIWNSVLGVGSGLTWEARSKSTKTSSSSQSLYGLREKLENFYDEEGGTVAEKTFEFLSQHRSPTRTLNLSVLNGNNYEWSTIRLGDQVHVMLEGYGFKTDDTLGVDMDVRITQIGANEASGKLLITTEEVVK